MDSFKTDAGAEIKVELVDTDWRIVMYLPNGRRVGKTAFATRAEALQTLIANSVRQ